MHSSAFRKFDELSIDFLWINQLFELVKIEVYYMEVE
jgi:hypothetical protein